RIDAVAKLPRHREHVTLYVVEHRDEFRVVSVRARSGRTNLRIDVDIDFPEDLTFVNALCAAMGDDEQCRWTVKNVVDAHRANPTLLELRRRRSSPNQQIECGTESILPLA